MINCVYLIKQHYTKSGIQKLPFLFQSFIVTEVESFQETSNKKYLKYGSHVFAKYCLFCREKVRRISMVKLALILLTAEAFQYRVSLKMPF